VLKEQNKLTPRTTTANPSWHQNYNNDSSNNNNNNYNNANTGTPNSIRYTMGHPTRHTPLAVLPHSSRNSNYVFFPLLRFLFLRNLAFALDTRINALMRIPHFSG
jgi:hypothetical protein